ATLATASFSPSPVTAMVSARPSLSSFSRVSRSARGSDKSSARPAAAGPAAPPRRRHARRHRLGRLFPPPGGVVTPPVELGGHPVIQLGAEQLGEQFPPVVDTAPQ